MVRLSLHLPARYRLKITLAKRQKSLDEQPFIPNLGKVLRNKNPNKVSVFFRYLFENEKIKKLLGANFAFLMLAASLVPTGSSLGESLVDESIDPPLILSTQHGVQFPVQNIKITTQYRFYHPGIDFDGVTGDSIRPIMGGRIDFVGYSKYGYGNSVVINHGNGTESLYAHLSKIDVKVNDLVTNKTKLGEMGASGRAFGDHLHLEIHENGRSINPLTVLPK